ncbi:class IV adenylate cyclase [Aeoliella sp. ICT_H6.2]|uniref:Class IV adenylate cyclase n=1 Tax=Aeoliella straminimaris TaxID=2954799 RepID=A0A9X2JI81_9BACT|nr:class IV adenylate cyclase [Aeoliella straminimaris]MCO6046810.1 class IV adenylate cyclase [Aeoliella straminimaris]
MQLEIEQKFRVTNADDLLARIANLSPQELAPVEQRDTYYNHPSRDFRTTDEALRIRRSGNGAVVTYKGPKYDTVVKTRPEIELPLAEPESWPALLEALGFGEVATVSKHRRRFQVTAGTFDVEVAIDRVDEVGKFAEIEIVADQSQAGEAQKVVLELAQQLGLGEAEPRSYLGMLLEHRETI